LVRQPILTMPLLPIGPELMLPLLLATCLGYIVVGAIRRVYFSPLSKFPGPKWAATTLWNEFYWDVVKRGTFMWKIKEMHDHYG
jgi:hypothetical protein